MEHDFVVKLYGEFNFNNLKQFLKGPNAVGFLFWSFA